METQITLIDWLMLAAFAAFVFMMGMWMHCAVKNAMNCPPDWEDQEYWNQVNSKQREDRQHEN